MVRIQGSTSIARPIEDVFDFIADERNEPKYNPRMTRVEKVTPGPVAKGTRWSATVESRGRPLDREIEVTDYTRPTRLGSTTSMSTGEIHGALTFEPDPVGTRISWSWKLQPKGLFRVLGPLITRIGRRQDAELWASLKRYLESFAPPGGDT
jgi:carbon monoxide dehydrogenase subunit G